MTILRNTCRVVKSFKFRSCKETEKKERSPAGRESVELILRAFSV